jgi:hypothetical protein
MTVPSPPPTRRLRDRHAGDTVETIRAVVTLGPWLLILLLAAEILMRRRGVLSSGQLTFVLVVVNPLLLVGLAWLLRRGSTRFAESVMGTLLSSRGTAHTPEFSEVESLIIRGEYAQAAEAYQSHLVAYPRDIAAQLRWARLTADHLDDIPAAIARYRRAREMAPTAAQETQIGNALIDLCRAHGDRDALRAELARFARIHRGTRAGEQARAACRAIE